MTATERYLSHKSSMRQEPELTEIQTSNERRIPLKSIEAIQPEVEDDSEESSTDEDEPETQFEFEKVHTEQKDSKENTSGPFMFKTNLEP